MTLVRVVISHCFPWCPQMHLSVVLVTNLKILYNCLWSSPSPVQNLPLAMAKGWWSLFCFNHHVPDTVHGSCRAGGRCPWGLICSVSPLSSHGSLHVAGALLQVIILVSKASVPFRSHFFLSPSLYWGQAFYRVKNFPFSENVPKGWVWERLPGHTRTQS